MNRSLSSERWCGPAWVLIVAAAVSCGSDSPDDSATLHNQAAPPERSSTETPEMALPSPAESSADESPAVASSAGEAVMVTAIAPGEAQSASTAPPEAPAPAADPGKIEAGGSSKCPLGAAALCDGFEGPAPGSMGSLFAFEPGNGSTATVDATKPYRGLKSVHLATNGAGAFLTETASFTGTTAATNNEMWGRIFIWFETDANPQSHDVFITLEDPASNAASAQLHLAGGSRGILAAQIRTNTDVYRPAIATAQAQPSSVKFPLETPAWQCWEWHTTPQNTLDFYIDGELYAPMSVKAEDNWPFPVFKKMSLGFLQFGTTPVTELWIDEVAVGGARIGCAN